MNVSLVAVIGSGTMGSGIAHVFATHHFNVILCDVSHPALERALETIHGNLGREVKKGTLKSQELDTAFAAIRPTTDMAEIAKAQLTIEAVPEDPELKKQVLHEAGRIARPEAILATNTSSISVTELAAHTGRPDRFIGMHFMNPVPVMQLVELIRGLATSDETANATLEIVHRLGKTGIAVNDFPGFVSNRVLMPMINEAAFCVMEGVATPEAVDQVMKLGMNHPMGPLTLADFIGLDVCLSIMEVLHSGFGDAKYRACPLLRKMVAAGWLGRKSGRGFFRYETAKKN
jgi:3-hydroxybutyryl-CoA dehydrogenase